MMKGWKVKTCYDEKRLRTKVSISSGKHNFYSNFYNDYHHLDCEIIVKKISRLETCLAKIGSNEYIDYWLNTIVSFNEHKRWHAYLLDVYLYQL